jgi:hypothetical protein
MCRWDMHDFGSTRMRDATCWYTVLPCGDYWAALTDRPSKFLASRDGVHTDRCRPNVDIRVAVVGTCAIFDRYSIAPLRGGVRRWI